MVEMKVILPTDYDLKIDEQVEKYLETKQKLTYFLVSASTAIIAFLSNFVFNNRNEVENLAGLAIISSLAGLITAGSSICNLYFEHQSYRLHLHYRYQKKTWDSLTLEQQQDWDRIHEKAKILLKTAFFSLVLQIIFAVAFFTIILI